MSTRLIVLISSVSACFLFILIGYSKANTIKNESVRRETALSATYQDNQNELSAFKAGFYEQFNVVEAKAGQLNTILEDAVKGRYEAGSSAAPANGQLISALVESYPDLSGLDSYDRIVDYIQAGRESYKQKQSKLLDMIREYDSWRNSGIIHSRLVSLMGVPSNRLEARIGDSVVYGETALNQMKRIVLISEVKQAYQTGEDTPMITPTTNGPNS